MASGAKAFGANGGAQRDGLAAINEVLIFTALHWVRFPALSLTFHNFNTHTMEVVGKKTVSEISETVAIGSVDTDFTVKLDVLPLDRNHGDFEISLKLNLSHFSDDDDKVGLTTAAVSRLIVEARRIALDALADYFSQPGQARQLSLFSNATPEPKNEAVLRSKATSPTLTTTSHPPPMSQPPRTDLRLTSLPSKVSSRHSMPIGTLLREVMAGYGCSLKTAAAIIQVARSKGLVVDTGSDTVKILDHEAV